MPARCAITTTCPLCRSSRSACPSSSKGVGRRADGLRPGHVGASLPSMSADIRSHRFISHFPMAQGAKLVRQVRTVRYPHQAVIFEEGTKSDCIYLVLTGRVALTKKSPGGSAQIIAYK